MHEPFSHHHCMSVLFQLLLTSLLPHQPLTSLLCRERHIYKTNCFCPLRSLPYLKTWHIIPPSCLSKKASIAPVLIIKAINLYFCPQIHCLSWPQSLAWDSHVGDTSSCMNDRSPDVPQSLHATGWRWSHNYSLVDFMGDRDVMDTWNFDVITLL